MPLEFYLQPGKIIVPKYALEFSWSFTEKRLHQVVLDTVNHLRSSSKLQLNASHQNCQEIHQLFKNYGQQLCASLLRHAQANLMDDVLKFVIQDSKLQSIPLELLHDGKSYYALSKGIVRSLGSVPEVSLQLPPKLCIAVLGANPELNKGKLDLGFGYAMPYVLEDWVFPKIQNLKWYLQSALSAENLKEVLQQKPQVMLASLITDKQTWLLPDNAVSYKALSVKEQQSFLSQAVQEGLELLILNSLELNPDNGFSNPAESLLQSGVAYLILINARLGANRIKVYLRELWLRLSVQETIVAAHRHALQALVKEEPLYWDWAMIELHINHAPKPQAVSLDARWSAMPKTECQPSLLTAESFVGEQTQLKEVQQWLENPTPLLLLKTAHKNQALNTLLCALRNPAKRWGVYFLPHDLLLEHFLNAETKVRFDWLLEAVQWSTAALLPLLQQWEGSAVEEKKLLWVLGPLSTQSLNWLYKLLGEGFHLVVIDDHLDVQIEKQYLKVMPIKTQIQQLFKHLERPVPELWKKYLLKRPNLELEWSFLQAALVHFPAQPPDWIEEVQSTEQACQKLDEYLNLSQLSMQLLAFCFLIEQRIKRSFLKQLNMQISQQNCDATLKELCNLRLLESSLDNQWVYIPHTVRQRWQKSGFFDAPFLQTQADALLRYLLTLSVPPAAEKWHSQFFLSTVVQLAQQGLFDLALDRLLQWAKQSLNNDDVQGYVLYLMLNLAENSQTDDSRLRLIHWVKDGLFKQWNVELAATFCKHAFVWIENAAAWELYTSMQTQLAQTYLRDGNHEDAAQWVTSASQMVLDMPKAKNFYKSVLDIIFLLIELKDTKKVNQIVSLVDFDLNRMKPEELRLVWLLDGHFNQQQNQLKEAVQALNKGRLAKLDADSEPADFWAYELLIELLEKNSEPQPALPLRENLALAYAKYQPKKAVMHHQWLHKHYEQQKNYTAAIEHIRWLLDYDVNQDIEAKQKRAHSLGWLYHKLGELEQSVRFYKMAEQTSEDAIPNT